MESGSEIPFSIPQNLTKVPGVAGKFTPLGVTLSLIVLSAIIFLLMVLARRKYHQAADAGRQDAPRVPVQWEGRFVAIALAGIVAAMPLAEYFLNLPITLLSRSFKLPWDSVSYHFPALVDFVQQKSLWSLNVPYQSYSFGYELIAGFPALFFNHHWGFAVANTYAIAFLMVAVYFITRSIIRDIHKGAPP